MQLGIVPVTPFDAFARANYIEPMQIQNQL
jgi:hypothetical protein